MLFASRGGQSKEENNPSLLLVSLGVDPVYTDVGACVDTGGERVCVVSAVEQ